MLATNMLLHRFVVAFLFKVGSGTVNILDANITMLIPGIMKINYCFDLAAIVRSQLT